MPGPAAKSTAIRAPRTSAPAVPLTTTAVAASVIGMQGV